MESALPASVIGRSVDELSWVGSSIRRLRNGGRGNENVRTAEVMLLSLFPRTAVLGSVFAAAHGVQPDAAISMDEAAVLIEAKGTRKAA